MANEKPILFSGPMIRAILEGRKTQTRRVFSPDRIKIEPQPKGGFRYSTYASRAGGIEQTGGGPFVPSDWLHYCPYGVPGDRLWIRETHGVFSVDGISVSVGYKARLPEGKSLSDTDGGLDVIRVTSEQSAWAEQNIDNERWRPSIFMPRWASRITLEITDVRVERLQEISGQDCAAEGMMLQRWLQEDRGEGQPFFDKGIKADGLELQAAFQKGWDTINGKRSPWESNPWVWVIGFKRVTD